MSTQALKAAATGQATPEQARNPYEHLKRQLEVSRGEFAKLVGGQQNADKFIRVVLNSVLANPELIDASRSSLVAACMRAAQDGLMPDGREAVLNIYSTKIKGKDGERDRWEKRAQYLPMVGGLIKKLYSGGDILSVDAAVAYRGDVFEFVRGDDPKLVHKPAMEYADADLENGEPHVIAAYVVVKLKNGEIKREVMKRRDIDKVRAASKSADTGPWKTWFDEMAIKSVIKRAYKQLPHSDAFDEIEKYDNEAMGYTGLPQSAAEIASRTLSEHQPEQQQPAALGNDPSEVLEQPLPQGEQMMAAAREMEREMSQQPPLPGVVQPDDKALATSIEVKMRAAKSKDDLDVQGDRIREVKDEALRLRLGELYQNELTRF